MDVESGAASVIDAATRVLAQICRVRNGWTALPKEVCKLQDTVGSLCRLLESIPQPDKSILIESDQDHEIVQELMLELNMACSTLHELRELLDSVLLRQSSPVPDTSWSTQRARWSVQKSKALKLGNNLHNQHQKIITGLTMLHISVTTDVYTDQQKMIKEATDPKIRQNMWTHISGTSSHSLHHPATSTDGVEPKQLLPVEPKGLAHEFQRQVIKRETHNEPRFEHLEHVFAAVTQHRQAYPSTTLQGRNQQVFTWDQEQEQHPPGPSPNTTCTPFCRCKCHTTQPTSRVHLSAFRATVGTFSFFFSGTLLAPCDLQTCRTKRNKLLHLTYTFPRWLLAAAVTLTFSNSVGTPELLLRITRRIPTDPTSIFNSLIGLAWRNELPALRRALLSREHMVHDARGDDGTNALHFALRGRRYEAAELLLHAGADPFQTNDHGEAPFLIALRHLYASRAGMSAADRARLEAALPMADILDASALTDLHRVVMRIRPLDVRLWLEANFRHVDVNEPDLSGWSPIYYAAGRGDAAAVQALLEAGASPNMLRRRGAADGGNPLSIACQEGHLEVVRLLIAAGAEVEPASPGSLPLVQCARAPSDHLEIARALVDAGASPDKEDDWHFTGLLSAVVWNRGELLDLFFAHGVDVHWCDGEDATILDNAVMFQAKDSVIKLLALGDKLDYRHVSSVGQTILHIIGIAADQQMMDTFLNSGHVRGINGEQRDSNGKTADDYFKARETVTLELTDTWERLQEVVCGTESQDDRAESDEGEFFDAQTTVGWESDQE